jgi:hypothetical protein
MYTPWVVLASDFIACHSAMGSGTGHEQPYAKGRREQHVAKSLDAHEQVKMRKEVYDERLNGFPTITHKSNTPIYTSDTSPITHARHSQITACNPPFGS